MGVTLGATGVGSVSLGVSPLAAIHVGTVKVWPNTRTWTGPVRVWQDDTICRLNPDWSRGVSEFPADLTTGTIVRIELGASADDQGYVVDYPTVVMQDATTLSTLRESWESRPSSWFESGVADIIYTP